MQRAAKLASGLKINKTAAGITATCLIESNGDKRVLMAANSQDKDSEQCESNAKRKHQ